jgi:hypothetical protein
VRDIHGLRLLRSPDDLLIGADVCVEAVNMDKNPASRADVPVSGAMNVDTKVAGAL